MTPWELGRLCLAEATWEESSRYLEECIATARQSGDLQALRLAQATLAERDLLQRRPAAAYARLAPLLDRPGLAEWQVTELLPVLAWAHLAHLELGKVEQAADVASRAVGRARAQGNRLSLVEALREQGLVALRQERWDDAVQVQAEAASARATDALPLRRSTCPTRVRAAACAKGGAGAGMSAAGGGAGDLYASRRASGSRADRAGGGHHALTALARGPDGQVSGAFYGEPYAASVVGGMQMAQTGDRDDVRMSSRSRRHRLKRNSPCRDSGLCLGLGSGTVPRRLTVPAPGASLLRSVHIEPVVHHVCHARMDRQFGDQFVYARHGRHMPQNAIDVAGHNVPA